MTTTPANTHPIGLNTPEEMALPPSERKILVGTTITLSAVELTLFLTDFTDKFMSAVASTADETGHCHPEFIDTMDMAKTFACKKIRERWEQEWKEREGGAE